MSVPRDNNVSIKDYNTISKYKDLEIKIEKMWLLKTFPVTVIVVSQGMIKKGIDRHMNNIFAVPYMKYKQSLLNETAHTSKGVLSK